MKSDIDVLNQVGKKENSVRRRKRKKEKNVRSPTEV